MTPWPCPSERVVWLWGLLAGTVLGLLLGWVWRRWVWNRVVFVMRDFDHSQRKGGDGIA